MAGDVDLVVVGSGLGGLCAAAMAARYGLEVVVLEAHGVPGGAAHGFSRQGFHFESGPSLWSGLGRWPSANPLAQVLRAIGESVPVASYRDWGLLLPEGTLRVGVGLEPFLEVVRTLRGAGPSDEWARFMQELEPTCKAARALPLLALRPGLGMATTLGSQVLGLVAQAGRLAQLGGAFGPIARRHLRDPFLLHWVDLLCFLISGLPMDQTSAAAMATLFGEWFEPEATLDYPIGGSPAVVAALQRGLERHGGELRTGTAVESITLEGQRATGVTLRDGTVLRARRGVISNASPWDTLALLPEGGVAERWGRKQAATPACGSFLHWHVGLRGANLESLPIHHVWVGDWQRGIGAERNMVVLSMPSLLDPSLAPSGHQVMHGYTPANEPWELWKDLERGSPAYCALKAERCAIFHRVLDPLIPDWRDRLVIELQGTPLTHRHYLKVHQGSYGPAWPANHGAFPGGSTPWPNLVLCGAGVFPGIGVPPVAVSGAMAAHRFVDARQQKELLESLGLR
ncbi:NAD(P)/FAD-dependent oxidoreductase [Cyanobium sp. FACHB-13342]|uniref:phytoene desaturase family protein n=1 Tax=Cyanobium sp. FACHB-13342 TaxID=2692793 RepID=UPI001680A2BE|nr:NAD(P)/FAD-dependent oxidoreductase [Cyanobium sp. FACHB-13342]MBD2423365.1 FAD-dependent oxidoreductase [Cyanobium sp. FACHB-13342]